MDSKENGHSDYNYGFDDLDKTTQHILRQHANEISVHARPSPGFHRKTSHRLAHKRAHKLHAVVHFVRHSVAKYMFALITSPQTVMADPVGASFALIILPMIHISLLLVQLLFLIGSLSGAGKFGAWFGQEYGFGYSFVNMMDPIMFDDTAAEAIIGAARKAFVNPVGLPVEASSLPDFDEQAIAVRFFNLDIAKSLLILCALVYERDDGYVTEAGKAAKRDDLSESERRRQVAQMLLNSSRRITWQAGKWGLNFCSVSDFTSIGGPFCGLFWPKDPDENWIIIAFKGTSPTNFSEFMVDATIAHHNAHSFFGNGSLHQGFYTSLAPGTESEVDPYGNILHSIKHVARSLRKDGGDKINLWITGHSLGSAIASLLHARLLFAPQDLGPDLILRQGYMYGTPRVADAEFISAFDFAASTPFGDTSQSLWRVIDRWDIVTHVPPGLADNEENRAVLPQTSLLNYGHFGTAGVRLTGASKQYPTGYEIEKGSFRGGSQMKIVEKSKPSLEEPKPRPPKMMKVFGMQFDPIAWLKWAVSCAGPGADHIPSNYYARLKQVKADMVL